MGGVGSLNPCPFHVGGDDSDVARVYRTLRNLVGKGGSATDDTGLDGLWRESKAHGIAAGESSIERATNQAYPHLATDALPYYERTLGLVRGTDETEANFRDRVWSGWVARLAADCPHIAADLKAMDSRISLLEPATSSTTQHGRAFGAHSPSLEGPDFATKGYRQYSLVPNFSTDFALYVLFDVGHSGQPTTGEKRTLERIRAYMCGMLPSWCSWVLMTEVGFTLDSSSLDAAGFGV